MATRKEEIIVQLGGDSKALMKELNMTKQKMNAWGREIAKEITTGHIPEAWKGYSTNVKNALKEVDGEGQKTSESLSKNMSGAATKIITAFLGFQTVKKVFTEIRDSLKEVSDNIDKFNGKVDVAGYGEKKKKELYGSLSEEDQRDIVSAQFQTTGFFDKIKIQAAKFGALAVTSAQTYAGMLGGKSFEESFSSVRAEQKGIWQGMKAAQVEADLKKIAEDKTKTEVERAKAKAAYLELLKREYLLEREQDKIRTRASDAAGGMRQQQIKEFQANWETRKQIAGDYNMQAMYDNLPGNPEAGERRNADQADLVDRIRAYGAQKPKTIRERMRDQLAARNQPKMTAQEAMAKLASVIQQDAMVVRVKLAK